MSIDAHLTPPIEPSALRAIQRATLETSVARPGAPLSRWHSFRKFAGRPTTLLAVLLVAHLGSRLWLHRTSPLSSAHNFARMYGVSLSLVAGRGFADLAVDQSPASAPLERFFELQQPGISRAEFAAYLASKPDPAKDPKYRWYMPLASTRIADVRLAALLWRVFGIDRRVLTTFYTLLSVATCAALFFIARRLTGSGWAGLVAAALLTISPIEAFLNTWSWRDSSPMWFTAMAMAWFVCGLPRFHKPAFSLCSYLALGVIAVLGIGWRIDCLLLAPFLGAGLLIWLAARRVGWRHFALAAICFLTGAMATQTAISAIGPPQQQTPNIGFHMAFYSDYQRCQLLGIENTFQVQFSDANTLDVARQFYAAEHPDADQLAYLSPEYCAVCRRLFFELLNYNLYNWIHRGPIFYLQALAGLDSHTVIFEAGSKQIQKGLHSPLRQWFAAGDRLERAMPLLFLIGVLATTCAGRQRLPALLLALFSVYYAGIMFFVLPDQKHLGVMLVPLYVFAGAGLWAVTRLFTTRAWNAAARAEWRRGFWRVSALSLVALAAWGLTCSWARAHSVARRAALLNEISRRAAEGTAAPETLRGERNFTVAIRPDSPGQPAGYLLKISASARPGMLVCRQLYFPRDWATIWGRALITRHLLHPNREQWFFVSCLQGSRLGDPCPHLCAVAIEGDARITGSVRVGMRDWDHPQISTLFFDTEQSPGSPAVEQSPSVWLYVNGRPLSNPFCDRVKTQRAGMDEIMPAGFIPPYAGRPLHHLIARSIESGNWKIAMSDGWRFSVLDTSYWSPTKSWLQLQSGDFNGDGLTDLVGQASDGQWWLAMANGGYHAFCPLVGLPPDDRYDFVGVGDFNGDCLDDLILRSTDGHWTLALSTGDDFRCRSIDSLPVGIVPQNILIGDFLGNGRSQLAALDPKSGRWTIASMEGDRWRVEPWGDFPPGVDWRHPLAADFCGTGHADVAAFNPVSGEWIVGRYDGKRFVAKQFGKWAPNKTWKSVQTGQFGDGRHAGLAALDAKTGQLAIAVSDGQKFTTRKFPGHAALSERFYVGTFSGGPRDELLGVAADGELWVGQFDADGELRFKSWGHWPDRGEFTDFRTIGVWPEREPSRP